MMEHQAIHVDAHAPVIAPRVAEIQRVVCDAAGLSIRDMTAPGRGLPHVAQVRQVAMYLARSLTQRTYPEIGRLFGGRDHSTVIHAVRQVQQQLTVREDVAALVRDATARLDAIVAKRCPATESAAW